MNYYYFQEKEINGDFIIKLKSNNKTLCYLTYGNGEGDFIYLYTIQTIKKYQKKGYAGILMEYFLKKNNKDVKAKIIGGLENIGCIKLLLKFGFNFGSDNGVMYK